jgi:hypothetical protein
MSPRYLITGSLAYIGLLILQVFILDHISIAGFGIPMVYPLIIMVMPVSIPAAAVLVLAFLAGFGLDLLSNSGGLNAGALTFMAFSRKYILDLMAPSAGFDKTSFPDIEDQGFNWFSMYSLSLIFSHQLAYYFIERFSFDNFFFTILRVFSGVLVSAILIWLIALLFSPAVRKKKR